jgi:hypothetical protein
MFAQAATGLAYALPALDGMAQGVQMLQGHHYHKKEVQQALEHHEREMMIEREGMRKENLHDIWEQKNNQAQTLMIVATLMFSCAFEIMVEGVPPSNEEANNAQDEGGGDAEEISDRWVAELSSCVHL